MPLRPQQTRDIERQRHQPGEREGEGYEGSGADAWVGEVETWFACSTAGGAVGHADTTATTTADGGVGGDVIVEETDLGRFVGRSGGGGGESRGEETVNERLGGGEFARQHQEIC